MLKSLYLWYYQCLHSIYYGTLHVQKQLQTTMKATMGFNMYNETLYHVNWISYVEIPVSIAMHFHKLPLIQTTWLSDGKWFYCIYDEMETKLISQIISAYLVHSLLSK